MRKKWYGLSFMLPILIVFTVYYQLQLYPFSDYLATSADFGPQYLPIYYALKNVITQGDWMGLFWSFNKGLGGSMASVYGFNSVSPFTLFFALVPTAWFPMVYTIGSLLRYGLAALAFFHFLWERQALGKKESSRKWLALIFAVSYGLSGYLIANTYNPNFLDNLVYFPLVMIGVEKLLDGKKSHLYPLGLALMCVTQFYTAYMAALGIALYSIYYLLLQKEVYKVKVGRFLRLVGYSLIGVGLSMVWLLPIFYNLLDSKASAAGIFEWEWQMFYDPLQLFIKLIPGSISHEEWGDSHAMPQIYLASLGGLGLVHYFLNKQYGNKQKMITFVLLSVIYFSLNQLVFDLIWHMGQRPVGFYFRNAWVFTWILMVISYRSFELDLTIKKQDLPIYAMFSLMPALAYWKSESILTSWDVVGLSLFLWASIVIILSIPKLKNGIVIILALVVIELGWNAKRGLSEVPFFSNQVSIQKLTNLYDQAPIMKLQDKEPFYRSDISTNTLNMNLFTPMKPVGHFTSSIDYDQIDLFSKLGISSSQAMVTYLPHPVTDAVFSIKYVVMPNGMKTYEMPIVRTKFFVGSFNEYHNIYQNDIRLGLGFLVTKSFNHDLKFESSIVQNQEALLQALGQNDQQYYQEMPWQDIVYINTKEVDGKLVSEKADGKIDVTYSVSGLDSTRLYFMRIPRHVAFYLATSTFELNGEPYKMRHRFINDQFWPVQPDEEGKVKLKIQSDDRKEMDLKGLGIYSFDILKFGELIEEKKVDQLQISYVSNQLIQGKVKVTDSEKSSLFLSLPYSKGWTAFVDGEKVKTYAVWDTFTGIDFQGEGEYQVELKYTPPGMLIGGVCGLISLVVWAIQFRTIKRERSSRLSIEEKIR